MTVDRSGEPEKMQEECVMTVEYRPVDADNHYYEALDAFTGTSTRSSPTGASRWSRRGRTPKS